jgi:hypothetical protein
MHEDIAFVVGGDRGKGADFDLGVWYGEPLLSRVTPNRSWTDSVSAEHEHYFIA